MPELAATDEIVLTRGPHGITTLLTFCPDPLAEAAPILQNCIGSEVGLPFRWKRYDSYVSVGFNHRVIKTTSETESWDLHLQTSLTDSIPLFETGAVRLSSIHRTGIGFATSSLEGEGDLKFGVNAINSDGITFGRPDGLSFGAQIAFSTPLSSSDPTAPDWGITTSLVLTYQWEGEVRQILKSASLKLSDLKHKQEERNDVRRKVERLELLAKKLSDREAVDDLLADFPQELGPLTQETRDPTRLQELVENLVDEEKIKFGHGEAFYRLDDRVREAEDNIAKHHRTVERSLIPYHAANLVTRSLHSLRMNRLAQGIVDVPGTTDQGKLLIAGGNLFFDVPIFTSAEQFFQGTSRPVGWGGAGLIGAAGIYELQKGIREGGSTDLGLGMVLALATVQGLPFLITRNKEKARQARMALVVASALALGPLAVYSIQHGEDTALNYRILSIAASQTVAGGIVFLF